MAPGWLAQTPPVGSPPQPATCGAPLAAYGQLLELVARAVEDVTDLDLTAELITHRFTPDSKQVLLGWYPRTQLEMDELLSACRVLYGT